MKHIFWSTCLCIVGLYTFSAMAAEDPLGWVVDPQSMNACQGYYTDPLFFKHYQPGQFLNQGPITISADQTRLQQTGRSLLIGGVSVRQEGRLLEAERAYLYRDPNDKHNVYLDLLGDVVVREPGKMIVGSRAHVDLHTHNSIVHDVMYRIGLSQAIQDGHFVLAARGQAQQVTQQDGGRFITLEQATYTTCSPVRNSWQVSANKIELNRVTGRGVAYHGVLRLWGIPVLYAPYLNFPIDKRRQTGFLFPTVGSASDTGWFISVPYYWNIHPQLDMTITPAFYDKRGFLLKGLLRYLTPRSTGSLSGAVAPHDRLFVRFQSDAPFIYPGNPGLPGLINANDFRHYFTWTHHTIFNPRLNGELEYTYLSDDYYAQDFGGVPAMVIPNQLPQRGQIQYMDNTWVLQAALKRYQTLHPVNLLPIMNQYQRWPALSAVGNFPRGALGMNYQITADSNHFFRSQNPGETVLPPNGQRWHIQPQVSMPVEGLPGYFTPTVQLDITGYGLQDQPIGYSESIRRVLPRVSIDTGLFFDRDLQLMEQPYQLTLEPRLYYLYVPFHDQTQIPIFDTGLQPFDYQQLFSDNRFMGQDRLGDANQLTLAVSSRLMDNQSGYEKARLSLGEIYYFQDRRVMLCGTPGCLDIVPNTIPPVGALSPTDKNSPLVAQVNYFVSHAWFLSGNLAWHPRHEEALYGNFNFHYQPLTNHILDLGYHFIQYGDVLAGAPPNSPQNNFNQGVVSFAWPLTFRWSVLGNWSYNFSHKHVQTYFGGVEYNSCCFATRLIVSHVFDSLNANGDPLYDRAIYLQIYLKGLGNFATHNPASLLMLGLPGFEDNFTNGHLL